MTWIKLDDQAVDHPKVAGLSLRAFHAWIRGLSYASRFLTDGDLPVAFLLTVKYAVRDELVAAGLWEYWVNGDQHGLRVHDYLNHQRDKATVTHQRDRNKERQKRHRNALSNGDSNAVTNGVSNGPVTRLEESQSREDQVPPKSPADAGDLRKAKKARAPRLPEWQRRSIAMSTDRVIK